MFEPPAVFMFLVIVAILVLVASGAYFHRWVYRNGVIDGYGFSRSPSSPEFQAAGDWLKQTMAGPWPELRSGFPDQDFKEELDFYHFLGESLNYFEGKYVVIAGRKMIGMRENHQEAMLLGYRHLGIRPFLVKKIERQTDKSSVGVSGAAR